MRHPIASVACLLLVAVAAAVPATPQTMLVTTDFYPAESEFRALGAIQSDRTVENAGGLAGLKEGALFDEVGFQKYSARTYALIEGGPLTIEIVQLQDPRATFSALTLLRDSRPEDGPPGDSYSQSGNSLLFAQGNRFVRIRGNAPSDLVRQIATSISNRIGHRTGSLPLLISHFPKGGYNPESLRYFLGPKSFAAYGSAGGTSLRIRPEMELAQAEYNLAGATGTLWLASFPTSQMAEEYLDAVGTTGADKAMKPDRVYAKRSGPLLGLLEGNFDPGAADRLLSSIQFAYSIKWIYNKNHHSSGTLWGIPMGILGTVVRSLVLTALLCLASIILGVGFAVFRLVLRGYAPHNFFDRPERTEMIRLKLNEN